MFNSMVLDHYDMLQAGQLDRTAMEKTARALGGSLMSSAELDQQTDDGFGLILVASANRARRYPMTSPAETIMSKVSFYLNGSVLPKEAQVIMRRRLEAAHERFGLRPDGMLVKSASTKGFIPSNVCVIKENQEAQLRYAGLVKQAYATTMEKYAINTSLNGQPLQKYPIANAAQVRIRIDNFEGLKQKLAAKYAFEYAENVAQRAGELGVPIPAGSSIHHYLAKTAALNPMSKQWIAARATMAPMPARVAYVALMTKIGSAAPLDLAVGLDAIDRQYELQNYYGTQFPNAVESVLSMRKTAASFVLGTLTINTEDVVRLIDRQRPLLEAFLDGETIDRMKRDPETSIKALPGPHKQMLLDVLNNTSS
jgi:hypothetical protein